MILSCYLCPKECFGVDEYVGHLRNRHVLLEPCSLKCNFDGCRRTFSAYKVLRHHIRKQHCNINAVTPVKPSASFCDKKEQLMQTEDEVVFESEPTGEDDLLLHNAPCIDELGVSQVALKFLLALSSSSSISESAVDFVRNSTQALIGDILGILKDRVISTFMRVVGSTCSSPELKELLEDFDGWVNPFKGIETQRQLISYLKKKDVYHEAVPHSLGKRWEVRHNNVTGKQVQVEVDNLFYYVPIESTIRLVLGQSDSWKMIDRRLDDVQTQVIEDWFDGINGQKMQKDCLDQCSAAIPVFIQIYFDEVETVNPLGSKTGIHKLGAFYFVIKNFPGAVNSSMQNIHLLALAHAEDLKKYSVDSVMKVIVDELKHLDEAGFSVIHNNKQQQFKCFLAQVVGDNLGLHSMLGYVENCSRATFACDLCMSKQDEMQSVFMEKNLRLRNEKTYNKQILDLQSGNATMSDCGIKRSTILTTLRYYHPANNCSADIMHDLFEGVLPCETKLLLRHILYDIKCITLSDLNHRIKVADYGRFGSRSKPSSVLESHLKSQDSSLGQRSAQMLLLFSWLPILLADILEKVDPLKLRLLELLKLIVEIVLAPSLSSTHLTFLEDLVAEHHALFKLCYPEKRLLYKHHRMVHYASIIRCSGPMPGMMVMRYEAKHNFAKRLAHIICNFRNISFSVAKRHQIAHAMKWMTQSPVKDCAEVGNGEMISVNDLCDGHLLTPFVGSGVDLFNAASVTLFGQQYFPGFTVLTELNEDGEPSFAAIDRIYVLDDSVYFIVA